MKLVLAILIGATCGAAVEATHPVIVRQSYHYQTPAAYYVPIPVNVPQYSVGMFQQADPAILERIAAALEKIASRAGAQGEIGDLPPEPEFVGLVRQNCASCHGITPKGNKLAFFDAGSRFIEPDGKLLGQMIAAISSGTMPKGARMEPADRLKLISGLTAAPEAAAKGK